MFVYVGSLSKTKRSSYTLACAQRIHCSSFALMLRDRSYQQLQWRCSIVDQWHQRFLHRLERDTINTPSRLGVSWLLGWLSFMHFQQWAWTQNGRTADAFNCNGIFLQIVADACRKVCILLTIWCWMIAGKQTTFLVSLAFCTTLLLSLDTFGVLNRFTTV